MSETDDRALNPATSMGPVTLHVRDLEAMSSYYSTAFAMEPLEERPPTDRCGASSGEDGRRW